MRPSMLRALRHIVFCALLSAVAAPLVAAGPRVPSPVSPGKNGSAASVEARCPTFQWAGVAGARGYEIAVFALDEEERAEPRLVMRADVAGDARGFTPSTGQCLERGERYAWSVAASVPGREPEWSAPLLFEIEAAPSAGEVDLAVETLRRYLDSAGAGADANEEESRGSVARAAPAPRRAPRTLLEPSALASPTVGARATSALAAPSSQPASLSVSGQVHLGAASAVFKDGDLFLWDDGDQYSGNTALGRNALASADYNGKNTAVGRDTLKEAKRGVTYTYQSDGSANTAVGFRGLASNTRGARNTAVGGYAMASNTEGFGNVSLGYRTLQANQSGNRNVAIGVYALSSNTVGTQNVAVGGSAMFSNQDGVNNTALGFGSLDSNTSGRANVAVGANALQTSGSGWYNTALGVQALAAATTSSRNTALGYKSGFMTTGHDNVLIQNDGSALPAESHVLRIGQSTSIGVLPEFFYPFSLDKAFIHGIRGRTTGVNDAQAVMIDSAGQLGTVSSALRTKQDIEDVGPLADRLLALRPVSFRYRQHVASDPDTPEQFGLVAEEVAEVFPELVIFDREGRPETVKYHLLSTLLVAEVQRLHRRLEAVEGATRSSPAGVGHGSRSPRRKR